MVGHFQVGGAFISETQQLTGVDIEISKDQLALAQADVICLGHIHKRQQIGDNIFYSGSIYRQNFGELEEKGFYIHETSYPSGSVLCESRFVETPARKLVKLEADFTKEYAEEEKEEWAKKSPLLIPADSGCKWSFYLDENNIEKIKDAFVRLEIKIHQNDIEKLDKKEIRRTLLEDGGAADVDIRLIIIPRVNVRSEKILQLETLPEKLVEMASLRGEEVSESILEKARAIESQTHDDVINMLKKA